MFSHDIFVLIKHLHGSYLQFDDHEIAEIQEFVDDIDGGILSFVTGVAHLLGDYSTEHIDSRWAGLLADGNYTLDDSLTVDQVVHGVLSACARLISAHDRLPDRTSEYAEALAETANETALQIVELLLIAIGVPHIPADDDRWGGDDDELNGLICDDWRAVVGGKITVAEFVERAREFAV